MRPIVVISDSLALPRAEPQVVMTLDSYPALLNARFGGVINCAYGGATSREILRQASYFDRSNVNGILILNFGIVDCTPRTLTILEAWILKKLHLRIPMIAANWLRKHRLVRKIELPEFRRNCRAIREMRLGHMLVIPIAPASNEFEAEVPGIQSSVQLYNAVLEEVFGEAVCSVDIDTCTDLMSDYHHMTRCGHQKIFEALKTRIIAITQTDTMRCI